MKKILKNYRDIPAYFIKGLFFALKAIGPTFVVLILGYQLLFIDRIYPRIFIGEQNFSGFKKDKALLKLQTIKPPDRLKFLSEGKEYSFSTKELYIKYHHAETIEQAYNLGRNKDFIESIYEKWKLATKKYQLPLSYSLEPDELNNAVKTLADQIHEPSVQPSVAIQDKNITVNPGKNGQDVDENKLQEVISKQFAKGDFAPISVPIVKHNVQLSEQEAQALENRAQKLLGKKLTLKFEEQSYSYKEQDLVNLLDSKSARANTERVNQLVSELSRGINREPQNARFVFAAGKVQEFTPSKNGAIVEEEQLANLIQDSLRSLEEKESSMEIQIPAKQTLPDITTAEVNDLGITELVARGNSNFKGSIPTRIHNIALAASRINGLIIKPDGVFSFNSALGDVSVYTGYQQAYVISGGRTVLGDGGGVCQVSTTLFRAALNAGLPIIERHAHSYRVSYYEQGSKAGLDATVYSPSVDLKIKNDTGHNLLIQTKTDTKKLTLAIELYGTKDGRVITLGEPRVWDMRPAPPALYQDDPTLPTGVVKQIDFAASGANASFGYKVEKDGTVLKQRTFYSNYRPWQAVYLRGTGGI